MVRWLAGDGMTTGKRPPREGTNFVAVATGWRHSLALKSDRSLVAWGLNDSGQTNVPAGTNFVAIAAGFRIKPRHPGAGAALES